MLSINDKNDLKWALKCAILSETRASRGKVLTESDQVLFENYVKKDASYEQLLNLVYTKQDSYVDASVLEMVAIASLGKYFPKTSKYSGVVESSATPFNMVKRVLSEASPSDNNHYRGAKLMKQDSDRAKSLDFDREVEDELAPRELGKAQPGAVDFTSKGKENADVADLAAKNAAEAPVVEPTPSGPRYNPETDPQQQYKPQIQSKDADNLAKVDFDRPNAAADLEDAAFRSPDSPAPGPDAQGVTLPGVNDKVNPKVDRGVVAQLGRDASDVVSKLSATVSNWYNDAAKYFSGEQGQQVLKTGGIALGAVATATAAYFLYKKFYGDSAKAANMCKDGAPGCKAGIRKNALTQTLKTLENGKRGCQKSANPQACMAKIERQSSKFRAELAKANSK